MATETSEQRYCFLAVPPGSDQDVLNALRTAIAKAGLRLLTLRNQKEVSREAVDVIAKADCVLADVTGHDSAVFVELGLAKALDKATLVISRNNVTAALHNVLGDAIAMRYRTGAVGLRQMSNNVAVILADFRESAQQRRLLLGSRTRNLFVVDWDRLNREDAENLCLELLTRMGFRRVEWEKRTPEVDLIAELPKRDPDGFEYREIWLVSLGRNVPPDALLDMAIHDPDYFAHMILRRSERLPILKGEIEVPVTFLLVTLERVSRQTELFAGERVRRKEFPGIRLRVWDRNYLTGLVYQYPEIGFKYFSDEGRAQSKYRKTPEELYQENVDLTRRLTETVAALTDERNKRVRAERDAAWKDISFAAAHKMGNPIFAIETNLDPLERRIEDGRRSEAADVIRSIRRSVEKAKAIVDQFKSLTVAQQVKPVPTLLGPLLDEVCSLATAKSVSCSVSCPPDLRVSADPERLVECFDELLSNSMHWFDKPTRSIEITVSQPIPNAIPNDLDSALTYALIRYKDNGAGVSVENKGKIFEAFFSTYPHGTGLGLALVRRIIEGHAGRIMERGVPGEGADFEIYLPIAEPTPTLAKESD
jgi:signal transduction histidine kinase/nucleoside 2-deoxyribosyltransferase